MWPGQPRDQLFDFSKLKQSHLCLVDDTVYNPALSFIQSVTEPSGPSGRAFWKTCMWKDTGKTGQCLEKVEGARDTRAWGT